MKPEQQEKLRLLRRKYNIHFEGPVERKAWPSSFENTFRDIQKLGIIVFDEYCESSVIDSLNKPWKASARRRAKRLAALADLCRRESRNEPGWRMVVEPEVMARFTVEVACPQCRKRLWRSEIEVNLDDRDAAPESLERRRRTREPCTCIAVTRGEDCIDIGLNPLFSDRAQEGMIHDTVVRSALPKQEQPDRVYGLRPTKNFEILLDALTDRTESHLTLDGDAVDLKFSPFRQDGDPLLFPFLILEAKSEKGQDSFGASEKQTAFLIRTLLQMQANLHHVVGAQSACLGGPLVWFFASKGEEWRVSACYMATLEQVSHYHIIDIWGGRITRLDDALRLLLIVDYIFDWARDLYRPTILHDLKTAVGCDSASLAKDSDIMSVMNEVRSSLNQPQYEDDSVLEVRNEQESGIPQSLLALDSEHGVIRHASFIQSLLLGLYITRDNLESLFQSFSTTLKAQKFAREVLKAMKMQLTRWTGHQRRPEESVDPQMMFYVAFALTAYMSPLWDQIRELSYLAISDDAIDLLLRHANFSQKINILPQEYPNVGLQALESFCDRVQSASITDNLYATMSGASLTGKTANQDYPREWTVQEVTGSTIGFIPDDDGQTRRLVSTIYSLHKIGRKEPSEPFIRISKRHDVQSKDISSSFVWSAPKASTKASPEATPKFADGVLLACASSGFGKAKVSMSCYYIVDERPETSDTWNMLQIMQKATSEGWKYFVNCRDLRPEPPQYRGNYNDTLLRSRISTYDKEKISKWLAHLTDIAKRATSPSISSPVQVPQAFGDVHDTSRSTTSSINGTPKDATEPASDSSAALGPAQATGPQKRPLDVIVINEDDDIESRPSKRQERTFESDYIPDELFQKLLDEQHFGSA